MSVTKRRRTSLLRDMARLLVANDSTEKCKALLTVWDHLGHSELTLNEIADLVDGGPRLRLLK